MLIAPSPFVDVPASVLSPSIYLSAQAARTLFLEGCSVITCFKSRVALCSLRAEAQFLTLDVRGILSLAHAYLRDLIPDCL